MWNIRISYFFSKKRTNLSFDIMLSNIVEVFMHFWTEFRGVKRVTVRGDITVFRGTFKFDNFYFNYHIEANQVNFSPFSRFELRTPDVHRSVPPNVHLGTVNKVKPALHPRLHELMQLCWKEPQDLRDAKIATPWSKRLHQLPPNIRVEHGRRGFSVRQLQEKSKEQSQPLYLTFVYLTKAFDSVCSDGLFIIPKKIGYSTKLVSITKSFHTNMKSTVNLDGETLEPFPILSVVKQSGCVLTPALQDLLIPPVSFIQVFYGWGLSAYSSRWQAVQLEPISELNPKPCLPYSFRWWCRFWKPHSWWSSEPHEQHLLMNSVSQSASRKLRLWGRPSQLHPASPPLATVGKFKYMYMNSNIFDNHSHDAEINPLLERLLLWCGSWKKSVRKEELDTKHTAQGL